jgi:trans-aconitate 2-methyltransferase
VDAWETTYLHQLAVAGDDHPVLRWVEGTALRTVRSSLDPDEWDRFRAELNPRLAAAYPVHNGRAWFPFRRIFVVARRSPRA